MRTQSTISAVLGVLGVLGTLLAAPTARANGTLSGALVTEIQLSSNVAMVKFSKPIGTSNSPNNFRPNCISPGWGDYFAFDHTTAKGRNFLATVTAALLGGKRISASGVVGANASAPTCGGSGAPFPTEEVGYMVIVP